MQPSYKSGRSRLGIGSGGVAYLCVAALILAAAMYTQANLLFWAFGLMVGGLAVSLAMALAMMRGLSVQRLLPPHGVCGDALVVRYKVTNHKRWTPAFAVVIHETWGRGRRGARRTGPLAENPPRLRGQPYGWVLHVGPDQRAQAEALCWPMRRGELSFERIVISSSFPFGVIRRYLEFEQPAQVLVYPRLYRLNRRIVARLAEIDPGGNQQLDRAGGHEEFFGLREYWPGDSVRMIDWKHSAKTGKLVSREMTQPAPPRVMLALDLTRRAGRGDAAADADAAAPAAEPKERRRVKRISDAVEGAAGAQPREAGALPREAGALPRDAHPRRAWEQDDPVENAVSLAASIVCDAHLHGYQIGLVILGAAGGAYPVHHSLPHRTRLLETLAKLDAGTAAPGRQVLPLRPTVVVTPSREEGTAGDGRVTRLGAANLSRYVADAGQQTTRLLLRRTPLAARRRRAKETVA